MGNELLKDKKDSIIMLNHAQDTNVADMQRNDSDLEEIKRIK